MTSDRRLHVPQSVPEDFAQAVATILLLGMAGRDAWDEIFMHPPEVSLSWVRGILGSNDSYGLVHADMQWWEHQLRGH
ncbi:MAG: hypothetical protein AB1646_11335 [Thermodesulfobacteriota bacterium]